MRDIRPESLKGFRRKIYNSFAPNFKLKQQLPVGKENDIEIKKNICIEYGKRLQLIDLNNKTTKEHRFID